MVMEMETQKTRQEYIQQLAEVQDKVYQMGLMAEVAVRRSLKALVENDVDLAEKVMEADDAIDKKIEEIEDDCILLIAKQQPIAHDLRVIATGFKISTDIERIGDHAFDIARTAKEEGGLLDDERKALIRELGDCAVEMVSRAMEAYRAADIHMADEIRHMDRKIDDIFNRTFYSLSHFVTDESKRVEDATRLLFVARFLERIGDHAVNIAEWVVYLETAERIHTKKIRHVNAMQEGK